MTRKGVNLHLDVFWSSVEGCH